MKGETERPMDTLVAIYNIKLPYSILDKIARYAIPLLFCSYCGKILQEDNYKNKNIGWVIEDDIKCLDCILPLHKLYKHRKIFLDNSNGSQ